MRLTIDEYARQFKMSKEMIHSKLRAKRLEYIIENGTTYIILHQHPQTENRNSQSNSSVKPAEKMPARPKTTVGTIIALYQKENRQLKSRIVELENKIDRLIDDKEQMLRDERDRIEKIYTNRDEQLKSFLELINTKLLQSSQGTVHDIDLDQDTEPVAYDAASIEASWQQSHFVELRKYLKTLELDSASRKAIKKRFANGYGYDVRVIQQNGEFFLDFSKYDYSDLLKH